jgi:RNA polymerase sigma-54 factor
MSLKLTTSLSQRLVLTPQLRQRIEMLQMTTLELTDLIQQQLLENPVLEEVPSQEEVQELAEKVLDHRIRILLLKPQHRRRGLLEQTDLAIRM